MGSEVLFRVQTPHLKQNSFPLLREAIFFLYLNLILIKKKYFYFQQTKAMLLGCKSIEFTG